ncbi:MAG: hypothetical protein R2853_14000 [Thermomicrobiales bacterium]
MEGSSSPFQKELEVAIAAALAAGSVVRDLYDRAAAASYEKGDGSPVTDADLASDKVIRTFLTSAFPRRAAHRRGPGRSGALDQRTLLDCGPY